MAPSSHIMLLISNAYLPVMVKQVSGFNSAVKQIKDNLTEYYLVLQLLEKTCLEKFADIIVLSEELRE